MKTIEEIISEYRSIRDEVVQRDWTIRTVSEVVASTSQAELDRFLLVGMNHREIIGALQVSATGELEYLRSVVSGGYQRGMLK